MFKVPYLNYLFEIIYTSVHGWNIIIYFFNILTGVLLIHSFKGYEVDKQTTGQNNKCQTKADRKKDFKIMHFFSELTT